MFGLPEEPPRGFGLPFGDRASRGDATRGPGWPSDLRGERASRELSRWRGVPDFREPSELRGIVPVLCRTAPHLDDGGSRQRPHGVHHTQRARADIVSRAYRAGWQPARKERARLGRVAPIQPRSRRAHRQAGYDVSQPVRTAAASSHGSGGCAHCRTHVDTRGARVRPVPTQAGQARWVQPAGAAGR